MDDFLTLQLDGWAALHEGDFSRALELFKRRHPEVVRRYGPNDTLTGTSFLDLAQAHHFCGEQREARAALGEALRIYESVNRQDGNLDRLETTLIEVCGRQGHFHEVERLSKQRIARLAPFPEHDQMRAITQDQLALVYNREGRFAEAAPLLENSLAIFQRELKPDARDITVCQKYLLYCYRNLGQLERAEHFGRAVVESQLRVHGEESSPYQEASDELAFTLAVIAERDSDPEKAREAVKRSQGAVAFFSREQGPEGKEAARSATMAKRVVEKVAALLSPEDLPEFGAEALPLPTIPFISHRYADKAAVADLLAILPPFVRPILFEPIETPPIETVSALLTHGVLGADGLIFIDSPTSRASFWTVFERDLAARQGKRMFRFDAATKALSRYEEQAIKTLVVPFYHSADREDAEIICRCLAERRMTVLSQPVFSELPPKLRTELLDSARSDGGIVVVFVTRALLSDRKLLDVVVQQISKNGPVTLLCWFDKPPGFSFSSKLALLKKRGRDHAMTMMRPTNPEANIHEADELLVRLYWLMYNARGL